ncbi:MAG: hypothetical protein OHK0046_29660 [Anaerolineae bacterium]
MKIYEEVLDFLTSGPTLEQIIAFELSPAARKRARHLMQRSAHNLLTEDEREELREFQRMDYFLDRMRVRAQRRLALKE